MIQKKARLAARQVVGIQGGKGVLGERLLWVISSHPTLYWPNGRFPVVSGHSIATKFFAGYRFSQFSTED